MEPIITIAHKSHPVKNFCETCLQELVLAKDAHELRDCVSYLRKELMQCREIVNELAHWRLNERT